MKKIFTIIVAVLVSSAAFAIEPGDGSKSTGLAIVKKTESTFNLFYQAENASDVKVSIRDANGKEIFSESVKNTDGFIRPYTFSQVDPGEYSVSVVSEDETYTQKLMYGKSESRKLATVREVESGKYLVAIPSAFYQGAAEIKIYSGLDLAHKQTVKASGDYGQVFNVKKLNGDISIDVIDNNGNKIN